MSSNTSDQAPSWFTAWTMKQDDRLAKLETGLRTDLQKLEAGFKAGQQQLETGLRADLQKVETGLRAELAKVQLATRDLRTELKTVKAEVARQRPMDFDLRLRPNPAELVPAGVRGLRPK